MGLVAYGRIRIRGGTNYKLEGEIVNESMVRGGKVEIMLEQGHGSKACIVSSREEALSRGGALRTILTSSGPSDRNEGTLKEKQAKPAFIDCS